MLKQLKKNKKKKGFTLIELVIVLAVLAIIALIAIPNFTKVRNDSMAKADKRTAEQIEKITLMAIANENLTDAKTYNLVFDSQTGNFKEIGGAGTEGQADTDYEKMLSEVNRPQVRNNGNIISYDVVVKPDMSVAVKYNTEVDGVLTLTE